MKTIAFFGLGVMGTPMAGRLRSAGHDVRVWNRTTSKAQEWARDGGTACATPAEAARGASSIHLMVADDEAVDSVLESALGPTEVGRTTYTIVDHSTVSVAGTRERARGLKASGHAFLSAPVFGGPANMAKGEGTMLIAGDRRTYDEYAPTLAQLVEKHWYVSDDNAEANAFKLMGNSMLLGIASALNEFYAIAKGADISPLRAFELFQYINPGGGIPIRGARMAKGDYAPAFAITMADKDARLMVEAAGSYDVPGLCAIREKMKKQMDAGRGGLDLAAINYDLVPPPSP
jgi:3-hydroxyisobutyrate dehydrogenase-like beta-hydroxyacid dehydrogenase